MSEVKSAKTPCMSGTCNKDNKVSPDYSLQENQVDVNQFERINGWSCPWHPLQIIAWFFLVIFATVHFGILVNYLPKEWQAPGYIVSFYVASKLTLWPVLYAQTTRNECFCVNLNIRM